MSRQTLPETTRRAMLKAAAGAVGIGAVGTSSGHPAGGSHNIHEHNVTKNAELVGYHSLGGVGSESLSGQPEDAMTGVVSEVWVEGDLGFVSFLSSSAPHGNRGVAILDVSGYTRADSVDEMRQTEMSVLSFIGNETEAGTGADVKVSDDGQYLAYSKQALGATYGSAASPSTEPQDAPGAVPLGVEVYDISDPGNPQYLGTGQGPNAGFHNCFVHEIGGQHYVFGVQGAVPGDAGVHVFRINPDGGVEPVNFWSGANLSQGGYDTTAANFYCHDFYVHDDPETGRPLGYVSYWNYGLQVIDLSDPENIEELGVGELPRTHYAQPAPVLLDDGNGGSKRVFMAGQEHSAKTNDFSGYIRIFDGDGLFDDGTTELEALDTWTLYDSVTYEGYAFSPHNADITEDGWITQAHYHAGVRFLKIQNPAESPTDEWRIAGKRYVTETPGGEPEELQAGETFSGIITPGAAGSTRETHEFTPGTSRADKIDATLTYGANVQDNDLYLEKNVGSEDDPQWQTVASSRNLQGPESIEAPVDPEMQYRFVVETFANAVSNYEITATYFEVPGGEPKRVLQEEGLAYYRDHLEVPEETQTEGIMAPNFWSAREENGVTFAGDINTGFYAIVADPVPVGTRTPVDIDAERREDSSAYLGGSTTRQRIHVDTDTEIQLRDRVPTDWAVYEGYGDVESTRNAGDGIEVFLGSVDGDDEVTYFARVEGGPGNDRVGPLEYSTDGGDSWEPVTDSITSTVNLGLGQ